MKKIHLAVGYVNILTTYCISSLNWLLLNVYISGDVFTWGLYTNICVVKNEKGQAAVCKFDIAVRSKQLLIDTKYTSLSSFG